MTDPRELLDGYAAEDSTHLSVRGDGYEREGFAPKAFAALRAVLDIHQPSPIRAGLRPELGPDMCTVCQTLQSEPTRRFRGDVNGRVMDAHEHADPDPYCGGCCNVPWPCENVQAITTALGATDA